ncbi:MAG: hypothetical protein WCQ21_12460 [Verrucomicrobiota bacterium]|jgi:hypothetical protein
MKESSNIAQTTIMPATADKGGLADRYMVGIRTIEKWQGAGIIQGTRRGRRIFFDVLDCDCRLRNFRNKECYGRN